MHLLLKISIVLTTVAWAGVGVSLTEDVAEVGGIGGVVFGWCVAGVLVAGLLSSPLAARVSGLVRIVMLVSMLPGLAILVAGTVDALDGHKPYFRPISTLYYVSLPVWLSAAWHVVRLKRSLHTDGSAVTSHRP